MDSRFNLFFFCRREGTLRVLTTIAAEWSVRPGGGDTALASQPLNRGSRGEEDGIAPARNPSTSRGVLRIWMRKEKQKKTKNSFFLQSSSVVVLSRVHEYQQQNKRYKSSIERHDERRSETSRARARSPFPPKKLGRYVVWRHAPPSVTSSLEGPGRSHRTAPIAGPLVMDSRTSADDRLAITVNITPCYPAVPSWAPLDFDRPTPLPPPPRPQTYSQLR